MDVLMKYAKKKTIFILSSITSGFITVMCLLSKLGVSASYQTSVNSLSDFNEITSLMGSVITIFQIIFYLFIILSLATAILSGIYFFKKNKQEYVILGELVFSTINTILLLLSMSGINAIIKMVKLATTGDYSAFASFDYASMISSITSAASNLKYFVYVSIILFIFNIFVLLVAKKVIHINNFTFSFDENPNVVPQQQNPQTETTETVEATNTTENEANETVTANATVNDTVNQTTNNNQPSFDIEKVKNFFKTKNGKITLGVGAAVIISFAGYKIYDNFFNFTKIDLAKNITADFEGKDGNGYITNVKTNIDYDKNNEVLADFINFTYPDYDYSSTLSNGDKVTITVKYSEETAKNNKIKVTNNSKTLTVKGLTERYKNASKLPKKLVTQLTEEADKNIKKKYSDRQSYTYNCEFDSMWFGKNDEDYDRDGVYAVYKITETYTPSYGGEPRVEAYYVSTYVTDVDSDYLNKSRHYWYTSTLYDDQYNKITDSSQIENALTTKNDHYTFDKIK